MKIIATLKSRNEERNIRNAIESYHDWVDQILLADGDSSDKTIEIAKEYPKVSVRPFLIFYQRSDGSWRNHEGQHLNFLFEWAEQAGADWIIHDDCDCVLNQHLKRDARTIIEACTEETIHAVRLYLYGENKHFLRMSYIKDLWQPGLWAWKASIHLRGEDVPRHFTINNLKTYSSHILNPPYCILHKFAPDEETIMRKVNDYKLEQPAAVHPRITYGEPEPLPEWAK